jgi:hypothetical protein
MIIDAMDILYSAAWMAFVSSRATVITPAWQRAFAKKAFFVMGVGQKKTPRAFVNACDVFVYTENLMPIKQPSNETDPKEYQERHGS